MTSPQMSSFNERDPSCIDNTNVSTPFNDHNKPYETASPLPTLPLLLSIIHHRALLTRTTSKSPNCPDLRGEPCIPQTSMELETFPSMSTHHVFHPYHPHSTQHTHSVQRNITTTTDWTSSNDMWTLRTVGSRTRRVSQSTQWSDLFSMSPTRPFTGGLSMDLSTRLSPLSCSRPRDVELSRY
jgi:hypothetical protein